MKSMTGFGRAEYNDQDLSAIVEIKTINSRYKDIIIRIPSNYNALDNKIRSLINEKITRGKVECNITISNNNNDNELLEINVPLARSLSKSLDKLLKYNTLIEPSIDLSLFTNFPELLIPKESAIDIDKTWKALEPVISDALEEVIETRQKEGNNLDKDIQNHLEESKKIVKKIKELAPLNFEESQKKLRLRLENYLADIDLDEDRFLTEVAILADKLALDEEITRLESHLERFDEILLENEPVGRKIDFLIQEMNRETNTIGSKTDSIEISNLVVDMKSEIEKIREQIQNVE